MASEELPQGLEFTSEIDESSGKRLTVSSRGVIHAPRREIFPLWCPVREEEWIEGWSEGVAYDLVYAASGFNEKNGIFQESFTKPLFFGETGPTTWVTTAFDPRSCSLEFLLIFGEIAVLNRTAALVEVEGGGTICEMTDTTTLLSRTMNSAEFEELEGKSKALLYFTWNTLRHYCETGEILVSPSFSPPSD